jgi:formate dehydrogenase iron-sulfur subunit
MTSPVDDYIARVRQQPGVTPTRLAGEPGAATTPYERLAGKPWIGAMEPEAGTLPPWDGGPRAQVQEAQRTAGMMITPGRAYGFFTDTTLCIGCKACEVACKQWNNLPAEGFHFTGVSYDNTRALSATTWRHVLFVEEFDESRFETLGPLQTARREEPREMHRFGAQELRLDVPDGQPAGESAGWGDLPARFEPWGNLTTSEQWAKPGQRWLLMSDVCKHCVNAPCLEACPTGSIVRTEFDTVLVQQDVCNGCGYCQPACPFGVIEIDRQGTGKAHKCTLCYDRLKDGLEPACAKTCPTDSIQFGPVDELLERARVRVAELRARGAPAYLYGSGGILEDDCDTSDLGGLNAFFLLIDRPEVYNLPAVPKRPSTNTATGLLAVALTGAALAAATMLAVRSGR